MTRPSNDPSPPTAETLRQGLTALIAESQALRTDVRSAEVARGKEMAQRRRENLINLVLLGGLALFMIVVLAVAYQNNEIAHDTNDIAGETRRTNARLVDCTTPGGECYKAGQQRTGEAVRNLQRIQIYIVECSREIQQPASGPAFDRLFEACVAQRLARPVPVPSPSR